VGGQGNFFDELEEEAARGREQRDGDGDGVAVLGNRGFAEAEVLDLDGLDAVGDGGEKLGSLAGERNFVERVGGEEAAAKKCGVDRAGAGVASDVE